MQRFLNMVKIGTHNGSFHADEALAIYILRQLPEYSKSEIVRTRDPATLSECDIVVDVGGVYDHASKRYDHHQRGFTETFSPDFKTKLSSAGLIYKHYGQQAMSQLLGWNLESQSSKLELLHNKLYKSLIEGLDGIDNGVNQYPTDIEPAYEESTSISSIISGLNPWWNEPVQDFDAKFKIAVEKIGQVFSDKVAYYGKAWIPARDIVEKAFKSRFDIHPSGHIIVLDEYCPYEQHLFDLEKAHSAADKPTNCENVKNYTSNQVIYAIFQDTNGGYRVRAISVRPGSFESRLPLPAQWCGLRDEELSKVSGIDDCVFVHATGFIGGNKTKAGAIEMASKSINLATNSQ
ncbi:hypothetical protein BB560_000319 [Smittium megazygosporum]|uniref:Metal-dependent protein hydrolase n=1 Tax=Smittium megazygosporum TaxID=133381 RepID=A0A2T9ZKR9_9FUNG|nr:hypothetical protein BB560_000319 [Smittium megazygosporum]